MKIRVVHAMLQHCWCASRVHPRPLKAKRHPGTTSLLAAVYFYPFSNRMYEQTRSQVIVIHSGDCTWQTFINVALLNPCFFPDDGGLRGFVRRYYRKANAASVDDSGHSPSARVLRGEWSGLPSNCLPGQDDAAPLPLAQIYRAFTSF